MVGFSNYFTGKKILVTGASGYLATNLINNIAKVDCTILRISRHDNLIDVNGYARIVDIDSDVRNGNALIPIVKDVDIIYHFAAQTSVYVAEGDPLSDYRNNVFPMINLLEACRANNRKAIIIFAGTSTEVGLTKGIHVSEKQIDHPVTIYDLHKLVAETYLKHYSERGIVLGTTLRLTNIFGPGPKSSSPDRGVLNIMVRRTLSKDPLTIYGSGNYIRDYLYIDDAISAFVKAAEYINKLNGKHYVIGSGVGYKLKKAINLVAERYTIKTNKKAIVKSIEPPSGLSIIEKRNFIADSKTFIKITGWSPKFTLVEGIDRTIDSILDDTF